MNESTDARFLAVDGTFALLDCALSSISTGLRAQNLRELRDALSTVPASAIYNHFCGGLLRPRFDDPEYTNDFASWAGHALNDKRLAERLGIIDPANYQTLEALRQEVLEVIDERMDESEHVPWAKADQRFHFIRSQLVVFDTGKRFATPTELGFAIPQMSVGSIYFHFINARWRSQTGQDDFRVWLAAFGQQYSDLMGRLAGVDPYFISLTELRQKLDSCFQQALKGNQ